MRKSFCTMDQLQEVISSCHFSFSSSLRDFDVEYMGNDVIYLSAKSHVLDFSENKVIEIRSFIFGKIIAVRLFDIYDGDFFASMFVNFRESYSTFNFRVYVLREDHYYLCGFVGGNNIVDSIAFFDAVEVL